MPDLIIHTGLNRKGDCVILLSPELYDKLIEECRALTESGRKLFGKGKNPEKAKEFCKAFTVIGTLSTQPKFSDLIKDN